MGQTLTCLRYHIIFNTKGRRPQINSSIRERMYEYIGGIVKNERGVLLAAGGTEDHIHLLVSIPAQASLADALRMIKSNCSKWVHETFPEFRDFAWQAGYGAFTVSYSNEDDVRRYIANQPQHHKRKTFQEELVEFLHRHEIPYDERYIWQ